MIDPILSLAFSIHSNKGVYALLLGSGVSSSARIPTGWSIVQDLVQKIAHAKGEDCGSDPVAWYTRTFQKDPDYAELLDELAKSSTERRGLLRAYIEPTDEDREQGYKVPTEAHKTIAELVAKGYVRVILTTNFDRLLEEALAAAGVAPTVISTPDAAMGAIPLVHSNCTVVKLHGDYLDTRIKNTPRELADYDPSINALLERVFDEFGLVVCGWSAEWDTALRSALERCKSRRFWTYWTVRSEPTDVTKRLIDLRGAQVLTIKDADAFFRQLGGQVFALESFDRPHPLSAKVAVANLERYITDDRHKILLHKVVSEETERVYERISGPSVPARRADPDENNIPLRISYYEAAVDTLLQLIIHGCYWGEKRHEAEWTRAIERLASVGNSGESYVIWIEMRRYPAMLLIYGGGLAALANSRYETLVGLLTRAKVIEDEKEYPAATKVSLYEVLRDTGRYLPEMGRRPTPESEHIRNILLPRMKGLIPREDQYDRLFDLFEYLVALEYTDYYREEQFRMRIPVGRFGWRGRDYGHHISTVVGREIEMQRDNWPFLRAGLCGGSLERLQSAKKVLDDWIRRFW